MFGLAGAPVGIWVRGQDSEFTQVSEGRRDPKYEMRYAISDLGIVRGVQSESHTAVMIAT